MAEFTKGELTFRGKDRDGDAVLDMDGEYFAVITFPMKKHTKSIKANAEHLVLCWKSQPDLYVALEELVDIVDNSPGDIDSFTTQPAKAALAKANKKGESNADNK